MRAAALLVLIPLALTAQTAVEGRLIPSAPPAQVAQPETSPDDLASIEGQVLNAVTGQPVKKANLVLRRLDASPMSGFQLTSGYGTVSDAAGNFAMKDIEPGRYQLTANRTGYVNSEYGARSPGKPGTPIVLNRAQKLKEVVLRITPGGVIAGRIVDEEGDPLPNVQVQLASFRYMQGRKQLLPANGSSTNDLGEYRIFNIIPGKYYLSATYIGAMIFPATQDRSTTPQPEEDYVPTYYPGTVDTGTATQVEVTPGGQLTNVNLALSKIHTVRVKGRVINVAAPGAFPVMVTLTTRNTVFANRFARPNVVDGSGKFELRGVSPGSYLLTAFANQTNKSYSSSQPLEVGGTNIDNVTLTLAPGITVSGRVRAEGEMPAGAKNIQVALISREAGTRNRSAGGVLEADGAFKLENVSPDQYNLSLFPLPDGFYVKTIHSGTTDVLTSGLDVSGGPPEPLDIVLSSKAGQITGSVQNPNTQQPAGAATVVLIPQEKERRDQEVYYKVTSAAQDGSFSLQSVVPGEYKAYAWEDIEPGAYMDADFLKPVESKGEAVSVQEGSQLSLRLTLIPVTDGR